MLLENVAENFKVSVRCFGFVIDINLGKWRSGCAPPSPAECITWVLGVFPLETSEYLSVVLIYMVKMHRNGVFMHCSHQICSALQLN